ncbi:MAG: hypothetical protein ACJ72Z_09875 [Pyrinomonadaceae bacterium]
MKHINHARFCAEFQFRFSVPLIFSILTVTFVGSIFGFDDPTVAEILKRHSESVGSEQARKDATNRVAIGVSEFVINLPASRSTGKVLFASDSNNSMLISSFDLLEYPFEKIGFFRGKVDVPFITPGTRSPIGSYLLLNDNLLSERLFGGVITNGWRMFDPSTMDRLKFGGRKKVNGKDAFVLKFTPKIATSSDSSIDIFFDAKTFQNIRTEYRQTIPDKNAYLTTFIGNQTGENINTLTEEFDDFRSAEGLTLPYKYTIKLVVNNRATTKDFRWIFKFDEYRIGQNFGEDFFTFEKK